MAPAVEVLWWRECPSWERALTMVREEMRRVGLDSAQLEVIEVKTDADATRLGFPGSPTIRIDGEDLQAPDPREPAGLTCRVYRRPDGGVSPLPDRDELRRALAAARSSDGEEALRP